MTAAAAPVFRRLLSFFPDSSSTSSSSLSTWLNKIFTPSYDHRDVPITEKKGVTMGMSMTEKQGGSDVRSNTTQASPESPTHTGHGAGYLLTGHKVNTASILILLGFDLIWFLVSFFLHNIWSGVCLMCHVSCLGVLSASLFVCLFVCLHAPVNWCLVPYGQWFTSAPMCDGFLTLAKATTTSTSTSTTSTPSSSAPSCFLVPRWLPDGTRNQGFQVMRLKDKLADRCTALYCTLKSAQIFPCCHLYFWLKIEKLNCVWKSSLRLGDLNLSTETACTVNDTFLIWTRKKDI